MLTPICSAQPLVPTLLPISSRIDITVSSTYVPPRRFSLEHPHTKEAYLTGPSARAFDALAKVRNNVAAEFDRESWGEEWAQIADGSNPNMCARTPTLRCRVRAHLALHVYRCLVNPGMTLWRLLTSMARSCAS